MRVPAAFGFVDSLVLTARTAKEVFMGEFFLTVGGVWRYNGRILAVLASDRHVPRIELPLG
jgi:hypothetical protein